jgi:hypothetical protein
MGAILPIARSAPLIDVNRAKSFCSLVKIAAAFDRSQYLAGLNG